MFWWFRRIDKRNERELHALIDRLAHPERTPPPGSPYRVAPATRAVDPETTNFTLKGLRHALYEKPDSIGTEEGIEYLGAWMEHEFYKVHAAVALNNEHISKLVVELKRLERFP